MSLINDHDVRCPICGKEMAFNSIRWHILSLHCETSCPFFEETFLSKRMLTLHIKIVHTCDEYDSDVGRKKMFFYFEKPFLVWLCIFSNSTS